MFIVVLLLMLRNPSCVDDVGDASGGLAVTTVIATGALDCDVLRAPSDARGEGDRVGEVDGGA